MDDILRPEPTPRELGPEEAQLDFLYRLALHENVAASWEMRARFGVTRRLHYPGGVRQDDFYLVSYGDCDIATVFPLWQVAAINPGSMPNDKARNLTRSLRRSLSKMSYRTIISSYGTREIVAGLLEENRERDRKQVS